VTRGIAEDEDGGDLDVSFKLSPTWLLARQLDLKVITAVTFLKLS